MTPRRPPGRRNRILRWKSRSIAPSIPEDIRDRMIAGMTVDTIIRTQERTVLSYLVAPLTNRLAKSMHER